jgi:hypothetical protein
VARKKVGLAVNAEQVVMSGEQGAGQTDNTKIHKKSF